MSRCLETITLADEHIAEAEASSEPQPSTSTIRECHSGEKVRLLPPIKANQVLIPGKVAPGVSHVGIVPDNAAGREIFSGISRFSHPFILVLLHTHLASLSSALEISMPPSFTNLDTSQATSNNIDAVFVLKYARKH
ncbi:hypothetical protein PR048_021099 [Dryococelus australis]|uniref:Uncharacterized protein n=1 Tax=Dryococelus australis TaxID=614101 RepID=A0ABQ9GXA5_9NEOP|nr:hypothetical protein PR048_021099 [Dryococelus australis]